QWPKREPKILRPRPRTSPKIWPLPRWTSRPSASMPTMQPFHRPPTGQATRRSANSERQIDAGRTPPSEARPGRPARAACPRRSDRAGQAAYSAVAKNLGLGSGRQPVAVGRFSAARRLAAGLDCAGPVVDARSPRAARRPAAVSNDLADRLPILARRAALAAAAASGDQFGLDRAIALSGRLSAAVHRAVAGGGTPAAL